jgi:hypothetical protein
LEASEETAEVLGTKAKVAAVFRSVGFHEREWTVGQSKDDKEKMEVVKSVEMGPMQDPHLDYGQGKIVVECTDIQDRARRRRKTQDRDMEADKDQLPPTLAPMREPPDKMGPPDFGQPPGGEKKSYVETAKTRRTDKSIGDGEGVVADPPGDLDATVSGESRDQPKWQVDLELLDRARQTNTDWTAEMPTDYKDNSMDGLKPPTLASGERINGSNKRQMRRENKRNRIQRQEGQQETSYWTTHRGQFVMPQKIDGLDEWKGSMCPSNLALHHPAAAKLLQYATGGCPCKTGKPWTKKQMWAAIARGPHISAFSKGSNRSTEGRNSGES